MRIALLGTRGIPANYGGFETFAEELSTRLAARGHQVTVYCREAPCRNPSIAACDLQYLPTIRHKYFDTIAHTFVSTLHLLAHRVDVALYCNGANAIFTLWPRAARHSGGAERGRHRAQAQEVEPRWREAWYLVSEWLSTFCPTLVITDAQTIQDYYRERYRKESVFIPYGAEVGKVASSGSPGQPGTGARPLFPLREPHGAGESRARGAAGFEQVVTPHEAGADRRAPYAHEYIRAVRDTRDPRVVMPGAIYGQGYRELGSHCFAYIHATEVGGTHPALIEAMGRGALVLYRNTPENAEVAGDAGIPFEPGELAGALRRVLAMPEFERERFRRAAIARVQTNYSWDTVTDAYEKLLKGMLN